MSSKIKIKYAVIASIFFLLSFVLNYSIKYFGLNKMLEPIQFSIFANLLDVIVCIIGVLTAYKFGLKETIAEFGLNSSIFRGLTFAFVSTLPMLICFGTMFSLSAKISWLKILVFTIIAPFAEEILFRAYVFRQFYRRANFGFWASVVLPSLLFGLVHLYQSKNYLDALGIFAITTIGGIFFSWLYIRWNDNFWIPFGVHFLMNLWWMIFEVDDSALGGWFANIARFSSVFIAIILTFYQDKIWKSVAIKESNQLITNES
jgi:hypothetical protein